jgi:transposase
MDILHYRVAGLDVHKDTVVVALRLLESDHLTTEVRTFATTTDALLELAHWLTAAEVTHVAMESTGVYWKPIYHILEGLFHLVLINPQTIKQRSGHKTDPRDARWLAELLQHGLLKPSFVPPRPVRELRDLTRQRTQLVRQKASVSNRIQKVLEDANIKLGSVISDVLGASGRDMLRALISGETSVAALANLARGRMRDKVPQLQRALAGRVTDHHRFLLQTHLDHVTHLDGLIERFSSRILDYFRSHPGPEGPAETPAQPESQPATPPADEGPCGAAELRDAVDRLTTIPGVSQRTAEVIVAEIGIDMSVFPNAAKLASWAGMCPGNDRSAGKRRSGRTPDGNRWLKAALVQAAWAASRTRGTYLQAQFRRLSRHRGRKRALVAVGHTVLAIAYHLLSRSTTYQDLGPGYLEKLEPDRRTRQLVRQLERLGHKVTLETRQAG